MQEITEDLDSTNTKNRHVIYPEITTGTSTSTSSSTGSQEQSSTLGDKATGFMSRMKSGVRGLLKMESPVPTSPQGSEGGRRRGFIIDRVRRRHRNQESEVPDVDPIEFDTFEAEDDWIVLDVAPDDPIAVEHPICTLPHHVEFSLEIPYDDVQRLRKIGEGAFGVVYRARYQDQLLALKEVASHHYEDKEGMKFIASLSSELRVMGAIGRHKNVLCCFGGCITPPNVFILCELMETTLADLIHRQPGGPRALPVELSLLIVHDILAGLQHLHQWSPPIVHRDLKPDNILLDKRHHACVADFGLSRTKSHTYLNTERSHAGTPEYLAPEVLSGKVNEKMDIYAIGVILWEMFIAQRPWEGYHPFAILLNVAEGSRLPLPTDVFPTKEANGNSPSSLFNKTSYVYL